MSLKGQTVEEMERSWCAQHTIITAEIFGILEGDKEDNGEESRKTK